MGPDGRGAYGFRIVSPSRERQLPDLGALDATAPAVELEWRHASVLVGRNRIEEGFVSVGSRGGSLFEIRSEPRSILLELVEAPTPHSLVHPLLTVPISVLARWRGDLTIHAGGFAVGERAWALVGAREAGKSTLLAALAERGLPLLADDLLVLDDRVVRAGPACVDLRPDAVERHPEADCIGAVGGRRRYRLATAPGPARTELAGFFLLEWGGDRTVSVERVPAGESLRIVYEHEYMGLLGPADPHKILDLIELPVWRVRRPRDWGFAEAAIDRMLELALGGSR